MSGVRTGAVRFVNSEPPRTTAVRFLRLALAQPEGAVRARMLAYALHDIVLAVGFETWMAALDRLTAMLCGTSAADLTTNAKRRGL